MKKLLLSSLILLTLLFSYSHSEAQTTRPIYIYPKPQWTIGFGGAWNLATNDAYGRANYSSNDLILKDNYGMRWGYGGFVFAKLAPGKSRINRIYLGFDFKQMKNSDFSEENSTKYDIMSIGAGYEYLVFGRQQGFRSYFGGGITANMIKGEFVPKNTAILSTRTFESSTRVGLELKSGLEFVFKNKHRNLGFHLGAKYNLMNLFTADNSNAVGVTEENLNDGDGEGGPGFKRYIGIVSIELGLNWYPDVKRKRVK